MGTSLVAINEAFSLCNTEGSVLAQILVHSKRSLLSIFVSLAARKKGNSESLGRKRLFSGKKPAAVVAARKRRRRNKGGRAVSHAIGENGQRFQGGSILGNRVAHKIG